MSEWIRAALAAAGEKWHTRSGLAAAIAAVAVSLIVLFAGLDLASVSWTEWGVVAVSIFVVSLVWWKTYIPKVPTGRVGFGIALDLEDSPEARQLRADFVHTLRALLDQSQFRHRFSFVEFSPSVSRQICNEDEARSIARRANVHFLLYGRARQRTLPQGPSHVIDLRGLVRHVSVPKEVSKQFGDDFGAALPQRMIIGPQGDMIACEFAARHVDAAARYVIGTAATLSADFEYAEQLLLDAEERLTQFVAHAEGAGLSALLDRVRKRVGETYGLWLTRLMTRYTIRRDTSALEEAERIIAGLRRYDPHNYPARLAAAMCVFLLRGDLQQARAELNSCNDVQDGTWLYSSAFLEAYEGRLQEAYRLYQRAFRMPLQDPTVPTQSEEFIQIVLDVSPERYWLYYCLGLINHRAKGDLAAARGDFTRFVARAEDWRFATQVAAATKWIQEIDAMLPSETVA